MVDRRTPGLNKPAESAGFFLTPETPLPIPTQIFYAGQSARRQHFLSSVFDVPVTTFHVDPEPNTNDLGTIVHHKLGIALSSTEVAQSNGGLIVAADTQTIVPKIDGLGAFKPANKTKPSSEDEVLELFRNMNEFPYGPQYTVIAGSATHDVLTADRSLTHFDKTVVILDQSSVAYLATAKGFSDYKKVFEEFYNSEVYARNGLPLIGLCDISSGLSLPVLTILDAVKSIDGVDRAMQDGFRDAFQRALHIVAIGMSPELFRPYSLVEFGWINEVTNAVLS